MYASRSGAQQRDIFRLILGQGAVLIIVGLLMGLGAAFICTRFLSSLLFGVGATDPLTFLSTPTLLASGGVAGLLYSGAAGDQSGSDGRAAVRVNSDLLSSLDL